MQATKVNCIDPTLTLSDRTLRLILLLVTALILISCGNGATRVLNPQTTFERARLEAKNGDPEFQNMVGFMRYHGEGIDRDVMQAHQWFHLSATNGHPTGKINDEFLHVQLNLDSNGIPKDNKTYMHSELYGQHEFVFDAPEYSKLPGPETDNAIFRGRRVYSRFCAGCHGLNGIAAFVDSPSFALNERLEKPDEELIRSVSNGIGQMPSWGGRLQYREVQDVVTFIRSLGKSYQFGIERPLNPHPAYYFLFGSMTEDHSAFHQQR
jgi:TPR repeat protein